MAFAAVTAFGQGVKKLTMMVTTVAAELASGRFKVPVAEVARLRVGRDLPKSGDFGYG